MKYLAALFSIFATVSSEANPAGILWTHPNGIGFRSGIHGRGLNSHIPTGGYPHSHGFLTKREAGPEPEADPSGILWTHPNGIGFRSGIYGRGLNSHIPTGGYPHSHGFLTKREAGPDPEADPAGILWTHPNGIGFRSGIYGRGLNSHIPTGGYPHSHGFLTKREAVAEPEAEAYYGYYPRYGPLNGLGYHGHTGSIHGGGYGYFG